MNKYEVGRQIFPPTGRDASTFELSDSGGTLVIEMAGPTAEEKREFKRGLQLRIVTVNDIIFILYRPGTLPWSDCPYYRGLSKSLHELQAPADGQGLAVHCMLVDSLTGVLVAQKIIGLDTATTRKLFDAVAAQPEIPDYDNILAMTLARYQTADLLELSKEDAQ